MLGNLTCQTQDGPNSCKKSSSIFQDTTATDPLPWKIKYSLYVSILLSETYHSVWRVCVCGRPSIHLGIISVTFGEAIEICDTLLQFQSPRNLPHQYPHFRLAWRAQWQISWYLQTSKNDTMDSLFNSEVSGNAAGFSEKNNSLKVRRSCCIFLQTFSPMWYIISSIFVKSTSCACSENCRNVSSHFLASLSLWASFMPLIILAQSKWISSSVNHICV